MPHYPPHRVRLDADGGRHLLWPTCGVTWPQDLPTGLRRQHGQRLGWPPDKIARFVDDPHAQEFAPVITDVDSDAWLPMDALWAWIADLRRGIMRRPFTVPPEALPHRKT